MQAAGGAPPESPLELLTAAPLSLDVTPLLAPPAVRHLAADAARAKGLPPPPPLDVSPLHSAGSGGDVGSSAAGLCVSPLPGMAGGLAARPAAASLPPQRSVLGERSTNSGCGGTGGALAATAPLLLPGLAPTLSAVGLEEEESQLRGSPSFAENLPLPSPVGGAAAAPKQQHSQQQHVRQSGHLGDSDRGGLQDSVLKVKAADAAVSHASISPTASGGSPQRWSIGTQPAAQQPAQQQERPAAAAAVAPPPSAIGCSFDAAERRQQQLGASAEAWSGAVAGICQAGPAAAAAAAASGAPLGGDGSAAGPLRDELLAMHIDMLTQFQVCGLSCALTGPLLDGHQLLLAKLLPGPWRRRALPALTAGGAARAHPSVPERKRHPHKRAHTPRCSLALGLQAQQACMGELVGKVLERNDALGSEVAALRRQLASLTTRRDQFLWL